MTCVKCTLTHTFSISGKGVDSYQVALFVVVPVFIIIIIAGVVYHVKKHHPQILRKSTKGNESAHCYENQDFNRGTKPERKIQANASEAAYDEIDSTDIDMSRNVYDQVDTDKVEYETVQ